jgi:hypothetical protein
MKHDLFRRPVKVLVGLGFPAEIGSVRQALALLDDCAASKRNGAHAIALKACRAAMAGEVDAETARSMFVAFAQRNDLLMPESGTASAAWWAGSGWEGELPRSTDTE